MQRKLFYFPELDALRTFAVLLTLAAHFLPAVGFILIPYSWYGVDIFFSISGFLITYILLLTKDVELNRMKIIGNFMLRRVLRLFPVYYLFIFTFWFAWKFLSLQLWKPDFTGYFFTYTPNILFYIKGLGYGHPFSHLWSLGVEEQFYLIWPWVVVFFNRKWLLPVIVFFIVMAYGVNTWAHTNPNIRSLPLSNFHTLGSGALLAYLIHYRDESKFIQYLKRNRMWIFIVSFAAFIVLLYYFKGGSAGWALAREFGLSIVTVLFVLVSIEGWSGLGWLTRRPFVMYLGKISYGIYLFHLPVPILCSIAFKKAGILIINPYLLLLIYCVITIAAAAFSFRYIERWFLLAKKNFT